MTAAVCSRGRGSGDTRLPEEPATAIFRSAAPGSEAATRAQIPTTYDPAEKVNSPGSGKLFIALAALVIVLVAGGFLAYRSYRSGAGIRSIAVLPFDNKSEDPDTDYLSDGLGESLIFRLSQLPGLKVSPLSSVVRYKGNEADIAKIAAELGVDSVMTGRMVKRGDSLNITVELVDVRNNASVWGERYERKMSDLMATQREIASTITQKLQLKLAGSEKGLTKQYTTSNDAYQLYLKGRFHFAKRTKEDLFKSIELFDEAVKLDPNFALAYVGIAETWTVIPSFPYGSPADSTPKAKAAIQKALEIDPELPEAHTVNAMIAVSYDWDWAKAEAEFKRALELDPNLAITHYRYAWTYLSPVGRHDEAIAEMKIAMEKEPLYLIQGANYAGVLMYARRYPEAIEQARKTYDLDPNFAVAKSWLCHTYNLNGRYADALAIAEPSLDSDAAVTSGCGVRFCKNRPARQGTCCDPTVERGGKNKVRDELLGRRNLCRARRQGRSIRRTRKVISEPRLVPSANKG